MKTVRMWIGGKWVDADSAETFVATNPAAEEEMARIPQAGESDVDRAIEAARIAFPVWLRKTQVEGSACVRRLSGILRRHAHELARLETLHRGTPIIKSLSGVWDAADSLRDTSQASMAAMDRTITPCSHIPLYLRRKALRVCAVIAPRNVPFSMVVKSLGSALAVGNTCIVRPPGADSLSALRLGEMLGVDIAPGAVNIVTGVDDRVDNALTTRRDVDVISFTGTRQTTAAINSSAAGTDIRLALQIEHAPSFIVFEDADLDAAVARAVSGPYCNSFMLWGSPGRYYVHRKLYHEFTRRFVSAASAMVLGDPLCKETDVGPVVDAEHRNRVRDFINAEMKEGARLLLGGRRPTTPRLHRGYFVGPTVFGDEASRTRMIRDEVFGPLACFFAFSSEEDLTALSHDDALGISFSIWTKDTDRAVQLGDVLQTDLIRVNGWLVPPCGELPFGREYCRSDRESHTIGPRSFVHDCYTAMERDPRLPQNLSWQTEALLKQHTAFSAVSMDVTAGMAKRLPINNN